MKWQFNQERSWHQVAPTMTISIRLKLYRLQEKTQVYTTLDLLRTNIDYPAVRNCWIYFPVDYRSNSVLMVVWPSSIQSTCVQTEESIIAVKLFLGHMNAIRIYQILGGIVFI